MLILESWKAIFLAAPKRAWVENYFRDISLGVEKRVCRDENRVLSLHNLNLMIVLRYVFGRIDFWSSNGSFLTFYWMKIFQKSFSVLIKFTSNFFSILIIIPLDPHPSFETFSVLSIHFEHLFHFIHLLSTWSLSFYFFKTFHCFG